MPTQGITFLRGGVYLIRFNPPDKPDLTLEKYVVCLQEGKLIENRPTFVGVLTTSIKEHDQRKVYPTHVYLTPEESESELGVRVLCESLYTIPKDDVIKYAYYLTDATMNEINRCLMIALGIAGLDSI